jgi:hypothetical protein
MAVTVLKCDVCNREISVPRNVGGVDVVKKCVITQGCRGNMQQQSVNNSTLRGRMPAPVNGLDDYLPRKALYNHEQKVLAKTWTVRHNMKIFPFVEAFVDKLIGNEFVATRVQPVVDIIDENTVTLTFDTEYRGFAQAIARATQEQKRIVELPVIPTPDTASIQLTKDHHLTIATSLADPLVDVKVCFTTPDLTTTLEQEYTVGAAALLDSPWSGIDGVTVLAKFGQQRFTVRSFDFYTSEVRQALGEIANGSFVTIKEIRPSAGVYLPLDNDSMIILYAEAPFEPADKLFDTYINATDVDEANAVKTLYISNNDLFAFKGLLTTTVPPIQEAS